MIISCILVWFNRYSTR